MDCLILKILNSKKNPNAVNNLTRVHLLKHLILNSSRKNEEQNTTHNLY